MGDFVDQKSSRIQTEIYSSIQPINYGPDWRAAGNMECFSVFRKENRVRASVLARLSLNRKSTRTAKRQASVSVMIEKLKE